MLIEVDFVLIQHFLFWVEVNVYEVLSRSERLWLIQRAPFIATDEEAVATWKRVHSLYFS